MASAAAISSIPMPPPTRISTRSRCSAVISSSGRPAVFLAPFFLFFAGAASFAGLPPALLSTMWNPSGALSEDRVGAGLQSEHPCRDLGLHGIDEGMIEVDRLF